jgi:hypothetical protein
VFLFSLQLLSDTFLFLKRNEWHQNCLLVFVWSTVILADFMKLEFSRQIFEKYSYHTSWKSALEPSSMRRDGHGETVAFRNFANAPKNRRIHYPLHDVVLHPHDNVKTRREKTIFISQHLRWLTIFMWFWLDVRWRKYSSSAKLSDRKIEAVLQLARQLLP